MANKRDFERILQTLRQTKQTYDRQKEKKIHKFRNHFQPKSRSKSTRSLQAQILIDIAQDCSGAFSRGMLTRPLEGQQECQDISNVCKSAFGTSNLKSLALQLKQLIQRTEYQIKYVASRNRDSTKETWLNAKSQNAIFTDENAANARSAAWQFMIQSMHEEKEIHGKNKNINCGIYDELEMTPLLKGFLSNPSEGTACHPTAIALRRLLGRIDTQETAGGVGAENRQAAVDLAKASLRSADRLYIIQLACTATADGHSFSLLMNYDGTVSVLEGWAMNGKRPNATLVVNWRNRDSNRPRYIDIDTVCGYLDDIVSENTGTRDRGYGNLSAAYGLPGRNPAHHFEEKNTRGDHDDRQNHSIIVTLRELRPYAKVTARIQNRTARFLNLLQSHGLQRTLTPPDCEQGCMCHYCVDHRCRGRACTQQTCRRRQVPLAKPR